MADPSAVAAPTDRVREIEMRLWEEVGTQLKGVTLAMKDLTLEMRDVRERLIRIEAQDQPKKLAALETDVRDAHDEIARVEKAAADDLAQAKTNHAQDVALLKAATVADITRVEKSAADDKLALEKRLTRMEIIIAPLITIGSTILAAFGTLIFSKLSGG